MRKTVREPRGLFSFFLLPSAVRKTNPRYIHGPCTPDMIVKHGPQDYTNGLESNSPTLPHAAKMATTFIYLFITPEGSTKTHTIQEKIYILMSIVNSVFCDLSFTKVMFACFCQQQCFSLLFCRIIQLRTKLV